jgi:hypothetical protein
MIPDIFDIENGRVVLTPVCFLMPELKAITEAYTDPIPAFSYLNFKFAVKGPYANTPEADLDEVLLTDYPGEYTLEDDVMIKAVEKLTELYITTTIQYYRDNKGLLEKLGEYARLTPVTSGRDGNISALMAQVKSVGKTITEFKILEKTVLEELADAKGRVRGNKTLAYDQS